MGLFDYYEMGKQIGGGGRQPSRAQFQDEYGQRNYSYQKNIDFITRGVNRLSNKSIIDTQKELDSFKTVCGGDHNASRMFLVNLQKLFSSDVIKAFKDSEDGKENKKED